MLGLLASAIMWLVVGIKLNALQKTKQGPLLLGRMFAFTIALSGIHSGFGNYFWALVSGEEFDNLKLQSNQAKG